MKLYLWFCWHLICRWDITDRIFRSEIKSMTLRLSEQIILHCAFTHIMASTWMHSTGEQLRGCSLSLFLTIPSLLFSGDLQWQTEQSSYLDSCIAVNRWHVQAQWDSRTTEIMIIDRQWRDCQCQQAPCAHFFNTGWFLSAQKETRSVTYSRTLRFTYKCHPGHLS